MNKRVFEIVDIASESEDEDEESMKRVSLKEREEMKITGKRRDIGRDKTTLPPPPSSRAPTPPVASASGASLPSARSSSTRSPVAVEATSTRPVRSSVASARSFASSSVAARSAGESDENEEDNEEDEEENDDEEDEEEFILQTKKRYKRLLNETDSKNILPSRRKGKRDSDTPSPLPPTTPPLTTTTSSRSMSGKEKEKSKGRLKEKKQKLSDEEDNIVEEDTSEPQASKTLKRRANSEPNPQTKNAFEKFGFQTIEKSSSTSVSKRQSPSQQSQTQLKKSTTKKARVISDEEKDEDDVEEVEEDDEEEEIPRSRRMRSSKKETNKRKKSQDTPRTESISARIRSRSRTDDRVVSYAEQESEAEEDDDDTEGKETKKSTRRASKNRSESQQLISELNSDDGEFEETIQRSRQEKRRGGARGVLAKARRRSEREKKQDDSDEELSNVGSNEDDENSSGEESEEEAKKEEINYRVQYILGSKKLPPREWRTICDSMNTREVTRGSVWTQPDEEYFSASDELIEKFLIKWTHASFLHVSWETRSDLSYISGTSIQFNKYFATQVNGVATIFDDLLPGEYFPPTVLMIDRVLDIDDDGVDIRTINWRSAILPRNPYENKEPSNEEIEGEGKLQRKNSKTKKDKSDSGAYLHSKDCYLTVKWENLGYGECTFEDIHDIQRFGVEYEQCLRDYYKREQMPPIKNSHRVINRKIAPEVMKTPPIFPRGELRDYQWDGVRWMLYNWSKKKNSILADEMGLGKTIQTAAFLQILATTQNVRGPFLIVAPLSTLVNWYRELTAWTTLDIILYYGTAEDREIIREHEFFYMTRKRTDGYKLQVLITSPETCLITDGHGKGRELSKIHWDFLVVDEAHRLKNHHSKLSICLREEYVYSNCLLLTGTPLQNNTEELWTLLHFVDRTQFDNKDSFISEFGDLKNSTQVEELHRRIGPYLLRRVKENVEKSVPPKEEIIIEVELTIPQKQYYRALYENNRAFLFRGALKDGPSLVNLAMELRKCCNHPYLVKGAEEELRSYFLENAPPEGFDCHWKQTLYSLVQSSGKFVLLDKLLPKLQTDGHRVLIFSQFRMMLDVIEEYLHLRQFSYDRIDGSITGRKRQAAIDRYCAPGSQVFIMLLSTKAGGVGINLTAADTVIIFDSDWNPQNDIQAQARAHRIGQTKSVKVYRLLTCKTYEMHMFQVASKKLGLDYAIMHNIKDSHVKSQTSSAALSSKEIEELLRHGAYDIFREEKDGSGETASRNFCEADIEQILQRSTVIMHGEDQKKSSLPSANFSRASFQTGREGDVDVNDPDFWSKVVGMELKEEKVSKGRHRKCKVPGISYAQEKVSISRKAEILEQEDEEYSESDDNEDTKGKPRGRTPKIFEPTSIQPAEWTPSNLYTLEKAYFTCGYMNWERIRQLSRLPYSLDDIAQGCRMLTLYLLRIVCAREVSTLDNFDDPHRALDYFNQSMFFRVVVFAYSIALTRKLKNMTVSISPELEIISEYYRNFSMMNPKNRYLPLLTESHLNPSEFSAVWKMCCTIPLHPDYTNYKMKCRDVKLRNQIKNRYIALEDHFIITHALKLDQIYTQEKNKREVSEISSDPPPTPVRGMYIGFVPFLGDLKTYLYGLPIEDSPAEWWVTGVDDFLLMEAVSQNGNVETRAQFTLIENFILKHDDGPLHRSDGKENKENFLIGGNGYFPSNQKVEHIEKVLLTRRLKDIVEFVRTGQLSNHFTAAIAKAIPVYGWPTDVIIKLLNNIPLIEREKKEERNGESDSRMIQIPENGTSEAKSSERTENNRLIRPEFLPTYEGLAKHTQAKIVRKSVMIETCSDLDKMTNSPAVMKAVAINVVKILFSLQDDNKIIQTLESYPVLKYNEVGGSKPLWWSSYHDHKLLFLVCKYGLSWRMLCECSEANSEPFSFVRPPPSFIVPQRDSGGNSLGASLMIMDKTMLINRFNLLIEALRNRGSGSRSQPKGIKMNTQPPVSVEESVSPRLTPLATVVVRPSQPSPLSLLQPALFQQLPNPLFQSSVIPSSSLIPTFSLPVPTTPVLSRTVSAPSPIIHCPSTIYSGEAAQYSSISQTGEAVLQSAAPSSFSSLPSPTPPVIPPQQREAVIDLTDDPFFSTGPSDFNIFVNAAPSPLPPTSSTVAHSSSPLIQQVKKKSRVDSSPSGTPNGQSSLKSILSFFPKK